MEDDLIFDVRELETVAKRISATLDGINADALPPDMPTNKLIILLSRAGDASKVIQASVYRMAAGVRPKPQF